MKSSLDKGFLIVTFVYLLVILLMLPLRQVGFEDDFAYYHTVNKFLITGNLEISEWSAASLISHTIWGSVFAALFGMSYKSMHASTVILFYFGLISFYLILRELNFNQIKSAMFTLILLSFPNNLRLAFTFMTDIPYISLMLITILFGVKALKTQKLEFTILAICFGVTAFLNRQLGLAWIISLSLVFFIKSFYKKKLLLSHIATTLAISIASLLTYYHWLGAGNKTNAQYLFLDQNLSKTLNYLYPQGTHKLRITNEIYQEVTNRTAQFSLYVVGLLSPMLLVHKISFTKVATWIKQHKGIFAIATIMLAFIYWRASLKIDFNLKQWQVLPTPELLPHTLRWYSVDWNKLWHFILAITFIPLAYLLSQGLKNLQILFLTKRSQIDVKNFIFQTGLIALGVAVYTIRAIVREGTAAMPYFMFIFLWLAIAIIIISIYHFYKIKSKKVDPIQNSIIAFLIIGTLIQMAMTVFSFFAWQIYIIPFAPLFIIAFASLTNRAQISNIRAILLVLTFIAFSLYSAKTSYDTSGIRWEVAESFIRSGRIEANEADVNDWAWIPYFYHEESFQRRLVEVGGDKYKIGQIHTWWDYPEYKYKDSKLQFSQLGCEQVKAPRNAITIGTIKAKNLFKSYNYCVMFVE